jgi:Zn finger protein HypA/HybF involved in hydrogenase expression
MIDTDKYEDELEHRMNKEFCNDIACGDMHKESAVEYAHEFYGNALDLLAEVKRLDEENVKIRKLLRKKANKVRLHNTKVALLAEVKGLRKVVAHIDAHIYEDSYCISCDDVWNWDAHDGECPTCDEEMKVMIE